MLVHLQQVIEVIVCAAGKAVDLVAFRIVAHGGIVVEMLRVQAAKALAGINAPFSEVGFQQGTQRVKGIRPSCSFLLVY